MNVLFTGYIATGLANCLVDPDGRHQQMVER